MKKLFLILFSFICICCFGKVELFEISPRNTKYLPGGKEADGIIGDFVLRNNKIPLKIKKDFK